MRQKSVSPKPRHYWTVESVRWDGAWETCSHAVLIVGRRRRRIRFGTKARAEKARESCRIDGNEAKHRIRKVTR